MTATYDEHGWIYRGRIIAPDPGSMPDDLWSCPDCAALAIGADRLTHENAHERLENRISYLEGA